MPNEPVNTELDDALMSALADGELGADDADRACALWRASESARSKWNDYQLIGDVLRSEELARGRGHDSAFLARVRAQLALEPVVLAPEVARPALPQPDVAIPMAVAAGGGRRAPARWGWLAPSAVAAGVVMVAGAWTLTRSPLDGGSENLSAAPSVAPQIVAVSASAPARAEPPESPGGNGALMRDERLDRYLAAHKQFSSASPLGAPPGALRQVTVEAAGR